MLRSWSVVRIPKKLDERHSVSVQKIFVAVKNIFVPFFNRNIVNIFFNWHWICEDGNTQTQLSFPSQRFWLVLLLKSLWVAEWNRNPWPGKMQHNYASMLQKATSHNALSDTTCRHNTLHARIQNFFSRGIGLDEWSDGYLSLPVGHIFGYFTTQF